MSQDKGKRDIGKKKHLEKGGERRRVYVLGPRFLRLLRLETKHTGSFGHE